MNAVDVLAVMRDGQTCAEDSRVLANPQFAYVQDLPGRMEQARAAVAELMEAVSAFQSLLAENQSQGLDFSYPLERLDAALARCKGEGK